MVLLTILSQASAPMPRDELATRAELAPDWFAEIMGQLESESLIAQVPPGYALTASGREAAEQARSRLLSPS